MLRRLQGLILTFFLMTGLCACSDVKVPLKIQNFNSVVSFQSAGTTIKGEITYTSPDNIVFKVKKPENIKDIRFAYSEKEMKVSLDEASFYNSTNEESPVYILLDIIDTVASSDIAIPLKGEYQVVLGEGEKEYTVVIDCESKQILSAKSKDFSFLFE